MNYYEIIKDYGIGKGEKPMWAATKLVSDYLEPLKDSDPEGYWNLIRATYAAMCGPHYNEEFAMWEIEQMFYKDKNGELHHSPRWNKAQYRAVYDMNKMRIRDSSCTMWDFAVVLEMIAADNHNLYTTWWQGIGDSELDKKFIEAAVNYLNDDDDVGEGKIWRMMQR